MTTDLIVAGGGPVGLGTAIAAALAGFEVVVLEPRCEPVDKACGEGLMPSALGTLRALGVDPPGRDFAGIRYVAGTVSAEARFRRAKGNGRGVRRTALHAALAARADELGVRRVSAPVGALRQDSTGVEAAGYRARWLVGADGLHSPVRRQLALGNRSRAPGRYGLRAHYRIPAWTDFVEVHWSAGAEAYVTPVGDDLVGVAVLSTERGQPFAQRLEEFPELARRLAGAVRAGPVLGAGPLEQRTRQRVAGRVLLVGDAAGYVDAITGEGLNVGLSCALELVACLRRGHPAGYERAWRRRSSGYRLATTALLRAAQHPAVRARLVPTARRLPGAFAAAVGVLA